MRATTLRCAALAQVKSVFAHQRQRQRMCRRTHSGGPPGALRVDSHFCQMRHNCGPSRSRAATWCDLCCTNEVMQRCGNQRRRRALHPRTCAVAPAQQPCANALSVHIRARPGCMVHGRPESGVALISSGPFHRQSLRTLRRRLLSAHRHGRSIRPYPTPSHQRDAARLACDGARRGRLVRGHRCCAHVLLDLRNAAGDLPTFCHVRLILPRRACHLRRSTPPRHSLDAVQRMRMCDA